MEEVNKKFRRGSIAPAVKGEEKTLWDGGEGRELLGSYLSANFLVVFSCVLLRKYPGDTQSQPVLGHLRRGLQVSSCPFCQHSHSPAHSGCLGPSVSILLKLDLSGGYCECQGLGVQGSPMCSIPHFWPLTPHLPAPLLNGTSLRHSMKLS